MAIEGQSEDNQGSHKPDKHAQSAFVQNPSF
jgi:hypothetical protein